MKYGWKWLLHEGKQSDRCSFTVVHTTIGSLPFAGVMYQMYCKFFYMMTAVKAAMRRTYRFFYWTRSSLPCPLWIECAFLWKLYVNWNANSFSCIPNKNFMCPHVTREHFTIQIWESSSGSTVQRSKPAKVLSLRPRHEGFWIGSSLDHAAKIGLPKSLVWAGPFIWKVWTRTECYL